MSKLPTAKEIIDENLGGLELTMDDDMWNFYKDVIRQWIESHTQAHTDGLREENARFKKAFADATAEKLALRERVKELEVKQSTLTSAMHESLTQLIQCDYVKANMLIYDALKITDEL